MKAKSEKRESGNEGLDYNSAERLWLMFFPHLTRNCGIALVQSIWPGYLALYSK